MASYTFGPNQTGTVDGNGNYITLSTSDTLYASGMGDVIGSQNGDVINGQGQLTAVFSGGSTPGNSTISFAANSGSGAALYSSGYTVDSSGNNVYLNAANLVTTVAGKSNTITLNYGGEQLTEGSGGNTIVTAANSSSNIFNLTGDTVNAGSGFGAFIAGTRDTINLAANSSSVVVLYSSGSTVNSVGNKVYLNSTVSDYISGGSNTITVNAGGSYLDVSNPYGGVGGGDTINLASNLSSNVTVRGSGNTYNISGDLLTLTDAYNDVVYANNSTIYFDNMPDNGYVGDQVIGTGNTVRYYQGTDVAPAASQLYSASGSSQSSQETLSRPSANTALTTSASLLVQAMASFPQSSGCER